MDLIKLSAIIVVVFIVGFASGMLSQQLFFTSSIIDSDESNDNSDESNNNQDGSDNTTDQDISPFIGSWSASEQSHNASEPGTVYYDWSFYNNETIHMEMTAVNATEETTFIDQWQDFTVVSDELMQIKSPLGIWLDYTYSFSNDGEELTLTSNDVPLVFTKE